MMSAVTPSIGSDAIDPVDNALALVVVDDLAHRRHLLLEAGADDLGPIVVALHELVALEVAVAGHARRLADLVVRGAAGRADPAAGQRASRAPRSARR